MMDLLEWLHTIVCIAALILMCMIVYIIFTYDMDLDRENYNKSRVEFCLSKNGKPVYDSNNFYNTCITQ